MKIIQFIALETSMLKEKEQFLAGVVLNVFMRKRVLTSAKIKKYHNKNYTQNGSPFPTPIFNNFKITHIDDGVLMGLIFSKLKHFFITTNKFFRV
ncbi:MAG: hypothetical protein K2X02_02075 [Alphaproteobacteria bacterium]|nr:hypothetical protein [Alphaproteobacteria bacterium]